MLRFLFLMLLFIHGLIHLMGFTRAFGLADLPQLKHDISPTRGFFWGLAGLLFFIVAGLFYFRLDTWWIIAIMGISVSQYLIIQHWHDTKFGTLINVLILIWAVTGVGGWILQHSAHNTISRIIPEHVSADSVNNDPGTLPMSVEKWLTRAHAAKSDTIYNVHILQDGRMKLEPNGSWYPFQAEQWVSVTDPGYVWQVRSGKGFMQFDGLDTYHGGEGRMKIEAYSVVPVKNASGDEIDQGSMVRYAAEMIWYPFVARHSQFIWQRDTDTSATVVMTDGGKQVNAVFYFDEEGQPVKILSQRYYQGKEGLSLQDWEVDIDPASLRQFEGLRIPTEASVTWQLPGESFTWLELRVTSIDYNVPLPQHTRITAAKN